MNFDDLRADADRAIAAFRAAVASLDGQFDNTALYVKVDLGHVITNLERGRMLLDHTEQIYAKR